MEKIKYCPKCKKTYPLNETKCECGYEFAVVEEKEDATVTSNNVRVINDNTPPALWTFLGFITASILTWIKYFSWKEVWPTRAKELKKGAFSFYITLVVVVIIYVLYVILKSKGKIV